MDKKKNTSYLGQFMGVAVSLVALALLYLLIQEHLNPKKPAAQSRKEQASLTQLQKIWQEDFLIMSSKGLLDPRIKGVSSVRVFMLDENLHKHFKGLKSPIKTIKKGPFLLEVSFMSHHSELENNDKIIVQYNLIDKDSEEMLWEISRTLDVPEEMDLNLDQAKKNPV